MNRNEIDADPNRWFYVQIFERDNDATYFIGKRLTEVDGDALYRDQDGNWFFVYQEEIMHDDFEEISIKSESVDQGRTFDELVENMRDWINETQGGVIPKVIRSFERSEIHDLVGYDS